ncbi:hypothetical protein SKAU_G00166870 [Synaphobranchus kaupii]|uniref:Uncharacterized protein n=1 Tax=Synaphobranchus kaupii TaxID=118154 RepID=A0A9Q1FK45_SYNKA|nr:hypothetical protein SKAU_G00166870 [Synaphobranchus kaupii]
MGVCQAVAGEHVPLESLKRERISGPCEEAGAMLGMTKLRERPHRETQTQLTRSHDRVKPGQHNDGEGD